MFDLFILSAIFYKINLQFFMQKQVESQVLRQLQKGNICTVSYYSQKLYANPMEILKVFIDIFRVDQNENFDLLCHIAIMNNLEARIQMERYSNIQKGVLIDKTNHLNTYLFQKEDIKQLKILAIFPKNLIVAQVESILQFQTIAKTKDYVNKFVVLPKLIVENTAMFKNKSKKEEKKNQKLAQIKKEKNEVQPKKNLKKTQSKSSIQTQRKIAIQAEQKKSIPLQKVSSKDQSSKSPVPVLTNYSAERQKLQELQLNVGKKSRKLLLESDEEIYPHNNLKQNKIIAQNIETDHSAKKDQKMEIQSECIKDKNQIKFIANDDSDDDDENLFAKMEEVGKKKETQSQHRSESLTRQKSQNSNIIPQKLKTETIKPKAQAQPQSVKIANGPPGNKNILMNFLKPKKINE